MDGEKAGQSVDACGVCGVVDDAWEVTATLIKHRSCGSVWGLCNGVWRLSRQSTPAPTSEERGGGE